MISLKKTERLFNMKTALHKTIYDYLVGEFMKDEARWISQQELLENFKELKENANETSHDKCPKLWKVINELNKEVDQLIMIKNFNYKVATENESNYYINNYFNKSIAPRLFRLWNFKKKCQLLGTGNVFDESVFRDTYLKFEKEKNNEN